jgi:hypothetical protein
MFDLEPSKSTPVEEDPSVPERVRNLPPEIAITVALSGAAAAYGGRYLYKRYFRRIQNSEYVTPNVLAKKQWIRGYVTRCVQWPSSIRSVWGHPAGL